MKTKLFAVGILAVLACGAVWLQAAQRRAMTPPVALQLTGTPVVGPLSVTPNLVMVGTSTPVVATVQITDPRLVQNGVNLLRVASSGLTTILGVMRDDGTNGDAAPGDKIFTLRFTLSEAIPGRIQIQASAAFQGILRRITSAVVPVDVCDQFTDGSSGVRFLFPTLGSPTRVVAESITTTRTRLDIQRRQGTRFVSVLGMTVYNNSPVLALSAWFSSKVDTTGILVAQGVFQRRQLSNGLQAYVLASPVPAAHLDVNGPVDAIYVGSANGDRIVAITPAHEFQPSDAGPGFENMQVMLNIASTVVFQ